MMILRDFVINNFLIQFVSDYDNMYVCMYDKCKGLS